MDSLLEFLKEKRKEGPLPSYFSKLAWMLAHRNGTSEREIVEQELVKAIARLNGAPNRDIIKQQLVKVKAKLAFTPNLSKVWCEASYLQGQLDLLQTHAEKVEEILKEAEQQTLIHEMLNRGGDEWM